MAARKPKNPSKVKAQYILFASGALLLGFIAMKTHSKKFPSKANVADDAALPDEVLRQETPQETKAFDSKAYKAQVARDRAQYAARARLGLKSIQLKEENGYLQIPFRFTPRKVWCQGGDLDTMKYASNDLSAKDILISLEPSSGGKGDSVRTSITALYEGVEHTFKVRSGNTQSYGLYICSDSKKGMSCKDKTLKPHGVISDEVAKAGNSPKGDYVFYFQHVVLDKKDLEIYASDDRSNDFKKSIGSYLSKQKDIENSEFEAAWKVADVTRSTSADVRDGRLLLSLPYNDPRCMGVRK